LCILDDLVFIALDNSAAEVPEEISNMDLKEQLYI